MALRPLSVVESLADPHLLGGLAAFRDLGSWWPWLVFLKARDGLPLTPTEAQFFCERTGRTVYNPPPGGFQTSIVVVGRQAGKSRVTAAITVHEAVTAPAEPDGTELYSLVIAQDDRASRRGLFAYCKAPFDRVPMLREYLLDCGVVRQPATSSRRTGKPTIATLPLKNGCVIAAYPCRPEAVRGLRARSVVLDEFAFYRSSDNYPRDREMLRAVRPTLATTGGRLTIITSPYAQTGALWDLHRRYFARDDVSVLIWVASAPQMNPTLSAEYLEQMREEDPEAYRSEVLGEFRAGVASLFDPDAIDAVVDVGVRERPREPGLTYVAGVDAASGTGADAFTAAIAPLTYKGAAPLAAIRVWRPPFNPQKTIADVAEFVAGYGVHTVEGDAYAPGFVDAAFQAHGIQYRRADRTRSEFYLELLPLVNAGRVRLLDLPDLLSELRGLDRMRGSSGRDRVDHRRGGHDDRANAAAIALVRAVRRHALRAGPVMVMGRKPSLIAHLDREGDDHVPF